MEKAIRVLIADASPEQTALLRTALEEADFEVTGTANDGETAYRLILETAPDVFVTDLLLPLLDGLSLLQRLKEEGKLPRTVVLSAFWNDRMARSVMQLGAEPLVKPCRAEALFRRVRELTEESVEPRSAVDPAVRRALLDFHVPTHLDGYKYLCEGLSRLLEHQSSLESVTKALYRDIGKVFHTNWSCVERSMRNAITAAWSRGSAESRRRAFGAVFDGYAKAPSVTRFLAVMAEYIALSEYPGRAAR